jgi:hypothetical protein
MASAAASMMMSHHSANGIASSTAPQPFSAGIAGAVHTRSQEKFVSAASQKTTSPTSAAYVISVSARACSLTPRACSTKNPTTTANPAATATYLSGAAGLMRKATYFPPARAVATPPKRHSRNIDQPIRKPSHGPPARRP